MSSAIRELATLIGATGPGKITLSKLLGKNRGVTPLNVLNVGWRWVVDWYRFVSKLSAIPTKRLDGVK